MTELKNICYSDTHERCLLDLYLPDADKVRNGRVPLIIWFHGGGLLGGDKGGVRPFAADITPDGVAVCAPNYSLLPNVNFPVFIEDAAAAVARCVSGFKDILDEYGLGETGGVFCGGSSAGGYLSMMLCFDKRYLAVHGIDSAELCGYIHGSGQPTDHFNILNHNGIDQRRVIVSERSPLYFVGLETNLAPMVFIVSDNDMFNRLEQNRTMFRALQHFELADNAELIELQGGHCEYERKREADGRTEHHRIALDFIRKYDK